MRVYRAPGPERREADRDKHGACGYRAEHRGGLVCAQLKPGHADPAGLHEHERGDLPRGSADQDDHDDHDDQDADADADQFLVVTGSRAFQRGADAGVFAGLDRPGAVADADADPFRLVADQRPAVVAAVGPAFLVLARQAGTAVRGLP
jgi:hypothetical protein